MLDSNLLYKPLRTRNLFLLWFHTPIHPVAFLRFYSIAIHKTLCMIYAYILKNTSCHLFLVFTSLKPYPVAADDFKVVFPLPGF